jgi:hypothetical protein
LKILRKLIKDLWILSKTGIVLFERLSSEEVNPDLFGAMMSALNIYAENLSEGGISYFDIKENRCIIIRRKGLLFVTKTSKNFKINQVQKELKSTAKKFFNMFSEESFEDWEGGKTSTFLSFKKELDD